VLPALGKRRRRNAENVSATAEDVSLTALVYVDMFLRLVGSNSSPACVAFYFCEASQSAKLLGVLPTKVSDHLSDFAAELLIPDYRIDPVFLRNVTDLARNPDFDCKTKFSDC